MSAKLLVLWINDVTYFLLTLNKYKKRSLWFLRRPVFDFLINIETQEEEEEEEE